MFLGFRKCIWSTCPVPSKVFGTQKMFPSPDFTSAVASKLESVKFSTGDSHSFTSENKVHGRYGRRNSFSVVRRRSGDPTMRCVLRPHGLHVAILRTTATSRSRSARQSNTKIMPAFLPKRRLTANLAGIEQGPCTFPSDRHNRNRTDYPQQRSSGLSTLRMYFSMSRRSRLIGFLPSSPVWVGSTRSSSTTMYIHAG